MLEDLQKYIAKSEPAISAKDMNTLGQAVRIINAIAGENFFVDASGVYRRKTPKVIDTLTVRLTAVDGDGYDWIEQTGKTDGTTVDTVDGRNSDDDGIAIDATGRKGFFADPSGGDVVTIRRGYDPDTDDAVWVIVATTAGIIPVLVSQTGGSNGNQTTAATWTYNVTDVSSNPITGGPFSPSWARAKGKKIAATHGNGYYDPSGNFVLEQVDEVDDTGHC